MQILFAILVLGFAIHSLNAMNLSSDQKRHASIISKDTHFNVEIQTTLGLQLKKAYDQGRTIGGCPPGTSKISGIGSAAIPLCWNTALMSGRCFNGVQYKGNRVCLANNQTSLAMNTSFRSLIPLLFLSTEALANGLREPSSYGNYNAGLHIENAVPNATGANKATAFVRLPAADPGLLVRSNYINCSRAHTECFTVIYCLNGTGTCSGRNRIAATYGIRHF